MHQNSGMRRLYGYAASIRRRHPVDDDIFHDMDGSIDPFVVGFFIIFGLIALVIVLTIA